ncbi:MAG: class I SAM-dependent methyltransferase [Myxococcota bacterium]
MACVHCGGDAFRDRQRIAGHAVRDCRACGLTQLDPMPPRALLDELYGDEYFESGDAGVGYGDYASQEEEYRATFADDVRRIRQFADGGRLLEVGCGFGFFLAEASAAGFDAWGVDASERAVRESAARLPGRVFRGAVGDVPELASQRFDVIFAAHLIEHISEPRPFLADLVSRLAPGGHLVLVTPNVASWLARLSGRRWVSFKIPEHVVFYAPDTMRALLEGCGLSVRAVDPAYQFYRLPFLMSRVRELVRPLDRLIPPFERWRPFRGRMLRVTSGSLRVIARKPDRAP